jgi:hypothetical protein
MRLCKVRGCRASLAMTILNINFYISTLLSGNSSAGRASVSQTEGRGFESRFPLTNLTIAMKIFKILLILLLPLACMGQASKYHDRPDTAYTIVEQQGEPPVLLTTTQLIIRESESNSSFLMKSLSDKHRYHTMVIRLNPGVKLITMAELLTQYHIDIKYWKMPISVNKRDFVQSSKAMVSPAAVTKVEIIKRDDRDQMYINITTCDKPGDGIG